MTVDEIDGEDIYCVWFEKNKKQTGCFRSVLLAKAGSGIAVASISR
jgi:hypothetical protein